MLGHDIPVLVRGHPGCQNSKESLRIWREIVAENDGFPPVVIDDTAETWFCSLGNGHFSQALNCFRNHCKNIFTGEVYRVGSDERLRYAIGRELQYSENRSTKVLEPRNYLSTPTHTAFRSRSGKYCDALGYGY